MKTSAEIAAEVLAAHAIRLDWRRTGEQIAALIAEAVDADRAQHAESIKAASKLLAEYDNDELADTPDEAADWLASGVRDLLSCMTGEES